MPRYPAAAGITKLSELTIDVNKDWAAKRIENLGAPDSSDDAPRARIGDVQINADKDWQQKLISNIAGLALDQSKGDLIARSDLVLVRIPPGSAGLVLTSAGLGNIPTWAPSGGALARYIPAPIGSSVTASVVPVNRMADKTPTIATSRQDQLAPTFSPSIGAAHAGVVVTPDQTADKTPAVATAKSHYVMAGVGGAVADDGGAQTDETAAANNDTLNDMTLLPAVPVVDDAYYLGYGAGTFPAVFLRQDTLGVGVWTITWEYWNDEAWVALAEIDDPTGGFKPTVAGRYRISFAVPEDWALTTVAGIADLYWIRGRVSAYTSVITQPKGTRAWIQTASG